jgi:hypothetical protein
MKKISFFVGLFLVPGFTMSFHKKKVEKPKEPISRKVHNCIIMEGINQARNPSQKSYEEIVKNCKEKEKKKGK